MVFRGMGQGSYLDWRMGDKVWCDGVPTGFLLIHMGIIRAMWEDSEPYMMRGVETRRVFDTPRDLWTDPETKSHNTLNGTSDLAWCTRVMKGGYFAKAGWHDYEEKRWPFLVDTRLACKHCNPNGEMFP
jgi:hypothetical protein